MRPDEHKKKKNAAYKKKHGITKESGDKKEGQTKNEKAKVTGENKHEPQTKKSGAGKTQQSSTLGARRDGASVASRTRTENTSSSSSSSDTESEAQSTKKSRTFRRREIVSNWQKYEIQPEAEEKVLAKGENYEKLLSMAGETIAHFRFKDELEWDDPGDSASENINDKYSQLISVNPAELVQSLACLPTYQTLGISENIFLPEQLSAMKDLASKRRSVFSDNSPLEETGHLVSPHKNMLSGMSGTQKRNTPQSDQQNSLLSAVRSEVKSHSALKNASEQKVIDKAKSVALEITKTCPNSETNGFNTVFDAKRKSRSEKSETTLVKHQEKLYLQDEELDALLGADSAANGTAEDIRLQQSAGTSRASNGEVSVKSDTASKSAGADNTADLEAWLDSVLDD